MSEDENKLKRDKLLLDLMIHAYDEEVARNEFCIFQWKIFVLNTT